MPDSNISQGVPGANQVRAILFHEGDHWVGQCVEYDICTQAKNLTDLYRKLELTVQFEREESIKRHGAPFAGIPAAPARFEDMWNKGWSITPADNIATHHINEKQESRVDLELALCA